MIDEIIFFYTLSILCQFDELSNTVQAFIKLKSVQELTEVKKRQLEELSVEIFIK